MNTSPSFAADFGLRLRTVREDRGLRQQDVEGLTGIPQGSISRYEHGKTMPNLETLVRLLSVLDVPADWLLGIEEE